MILLLQDTAEFTYQHASTAAIGVTNRVDSGRDAEGRWRQHTLCGLLLHTSLAVTEEGVPLGVTAVKVWTQAKFRGTAALKCVPNYTRVAIEGKEKESVRWLDNIRQLMDLLGERERLVHVADCESDIYELFCLVLDLGTHCMILICNDRLAGDGTHTVVSEMAEARVCGLHHVELRDAQGEMIHAVLAIRARRVHLLAPVGKQKHHPPLDLTVLLVTKRDPPRSRSKR